jgi:hypothetical protein
MDTPDVHDDSVDGCGDSLAHIPFSGYPAR